MLTRTRPNSFALSGAFTRSVQSTGRSTGQVDTVALIASSPCILAHRPLQRQCSARATNPAPHSVPVDVPQDGQQMFVARHRESLKPEPSLIQMTVPDGPVRDPPTHRMRVCQPTEEGRHLAVCVRPDGEVPCASIMTRWNASKSASLPKRCILPTDRVSTWYTCPPGAFRAALGMRIPRSGGRRQYKLRPCFRPRLLHHPVGFKRE